MQAFYQKFLRGCGNGIFNRQRSGGIERVFGEIH